MTNDSARELLRAAELCRSIADDLNKNSPEQKAALRCAEEITALLSENANAKLMTDEQAAETDPYNCGVRP